MELIRQGLNEDHILKKFITIILLHLTVNISLYADEIILQKNNIIITNDDLKKYKKLHQDFYGVNLLQAIADCRLLHHFVEQFHTFRC